MPHADSRAHRSVRAVRVTVALLLVVHGLARVSLGIVDDFGVFLGGVGFPFGNVLAWGATVFEIVGGAILAMGRAVRPISALMCLELAVGIVLVHWPAGWFVVGAGRNGMEYSVLLIVCLVAVFYAAGGPESDDAASEPGGAS